MACFHVNLIQQSLKLIFKQMFFSIHEDNAAKLNLKIKKYIQKKKVQIFL